MAPQIRYVETTPTKWQGSDARWQQVLVDHSDCVRMVATPIYDTAMQFDDVGVEVCGYRLESGRIIEQVIYCIEDDILYSVREPGLLITYKKQVDELKYAAAQVVDVIAAFN